MEEQPDYQISGGSDRSAVFENTRQSEILRACFVHFDVPLSEGQAYPKDLPKKYVDAITMAMSKYKDDEKPALVKQLESQKQFIIDLEKRQMDYEGWRYKELMEESVRIRERIKQDILLVDVFPPESKS